ncbi:MAG: DUF1311 domain-containing protein [Methyloprofundus sp.]|nr:DUF1311 domain-containing protein [Methyloprofundus sp.]
MTQSEMNQCAGIALKEADAELNRVYSKIRQLYKDDDKFIGKLRDAQRAWIKSRDADIEMQYPYMRDSSYYGSSFPVCVSRYTAMITLQRIEYLKKWLIGVKEGDVCSGSIMLIDNIIPQKIETTNEASLLPLE